jgi:hypothetical protein
LRCRRRVVHCRARVERRLFAWDEELRGSGSQMVTSFDRAATSPTDSPTTKPSLQTTRSSVSSRSDGGVANRLGSGGSCANWRRRVAFALLVTKEQRW